MRSRNIIFYAFIVCLAFAFVVPMTASASVGDVSHSCQGTECTVVKQIDNGWMGTGLWINYQPMADVQEISNSGQCLTDCYAIYRIIPYQPINVADSSVQIINGESSPYVITDLGLKARMIGPKPIPVPIVNPEFNFSFTNSDKLSNIQYYILQNVTDEIPRQLCDNVEYGTYANGTKAYTTSCDTIYDEITTEKFVPFDFYGYSSEDTSPMTIKITADKITNANVEHTLTLYGSPIPELSYWNASWLYNQNFTFYNTGTNLTYYQMKLSLNLTPLYTAGKLQSGCEDIRFTFWNSTTDNETEIPYWLKSCNTTDQTINSTIWVNVTFMGNVQNETIKMYYGNPTATATGNASKVFDIYDNTSGTFLDTSIWTQVGTKVAEIGLGYIEINGSNSWNNNGIYYAKGYVNTTNCGFHVFVL